MSRLLEPTKFTSLQLELLNLYAVNPAEHDLLEIKDMLAKYFMRKAISQIAEMEAKRGTTDADLDKLLHDENQ